ncbi:hypothetical protein X760_05880 [Mesorhizobium sp. LSHC422A00]|nr:hypothetical protein X760_05880 [Mesorhizobium sp. LSHC422A00]
MQESVLGRAEELICADVDAVIGNPPWKTLHPTDGKRLAATYGPLLSARFDVYLAFILRADEMLRAGGMLAMVLPSAFLYNDSASDVRSFLLDRYDPIYLATYPRTAFVEYRGIAPVVIILRKKSAKVVSSTVTRIEMYRSLDETACPAASHTVNPGRDWKGPRAAFAHSAEVLPSSAVAHSHRRTSFTELGLFSSGAKYSSSRGKAADVPFTGVSARNLAPFHVNAGAAVGFAEGAAVFDRPPPVQFLLTTKTFFQTVRCVSLAQRLVAATGKAGELACSTSAMFVPFEPDHAHFISGLLNSSFANAWYKSRDYNHSIKISVLKGLDIPVELSLWNEIGRCARDLSAHQTRVRDNWAATPNRSGAMRSHIDDGDPEGLRRKLDDLVFDLYEVREPDRARLKTLSETRSF